MAFQTLLPRGTVLKAKDRRKYTDKEWLSYEYIEIVDYKIGFYLVSLLSKNFIKHETKMSTNVFLEVAQVRDQYEISLKYSLKNL